MLRRASPSVRRSHAHCVRAWLKHFSTSPVSYKRQAKPTVEVNFNDNDEQPTVTVTATRPSDSAATSFLKRVERLLYLDNPSAALGHARARLNNAPSFPVTSELVEKVIEEFLRHEKTEEANNLYSRMFDGRLTASSRLRTTMLLINCVRSDLREDDIIAEFDKVFASAKDDVDETRMMWLVAYLSQLGRPPTFQERVLNSFAAVQGPNYRVCPDLVTHMITAYSEAGRTKDARRWLIYHSQKVSDESIPPHPKDAFPYTTYIHAINRNTTGRYKYGAVLYRMWKDNVLPDTAFFNVLIKAQVNEERYGKAFQLYNALQSHYTNERYPDAFTYGVLFKALEDYLGNRKPGAGERKLARNMIPPRLLFRQMLGWRNFAPHAQSTPSSPVITRSILTLALRAFVNAGDDAGALVVLQTFAILDMRLELDASQAVLKGLDRRVRTYLESSTRRREDLDWVFRFLGYQWEDRSMLKRCHPATMWKTIVQLGMKCSPDAPPLPTIVARNKKRHARRTENNDARLILKEEKSNEARIFITNLLRRSLEASSALSFESSIEANAARWTYCKDELLNAIAEMIPPMDKKATDVVMES